MLNYEDFYDMAEYANENWKGSFTQKEIACNAYDYLVEYEASIKLGRTSTISTLIYELNEDTRDRNCDDRVEDWLRELMRTPTSKNVGKTEVLTSQMNYKPKSR